MTNDSTADSDDEYRVTSCFRVGEVFVGIATPRSSSGAADSNSIRAMGYQHTVRFARSFDALATARDFYVYELADLARAATLAEPVLLASELTGC
ncbi:MAG: hypothetical protein R3B46_01880 [Phycisphaerales bacterium]|nr:hypothetical protein [Phycisphaerales bacterium]